MTTTKHRVTITIEKAAAEQALFVLESVQPILTGDRYVAIGLAIGVFKDIVEQAEDQNRKEWEDAMRHNTL